MRDHSLLRRDGFGDPGGVDAHADTVVELVFNGALRSPEPEPPRPRPRSRK